MSKNVKKWQKCQKMAKNGVFLGGVIFPKKRAENVGRADLEKSTFLGRNSPFFLAKIEQKS